MMAKNTNTVEQLVGSLVDRFNGLGLGQKILAGTLAFGLVGASLLLFQQMNENYEVLYSNMSLTDAGAAATKLQELGKPYRLADGGTTILVPSKDRNQLLLETANELTSDQPVSLTKIPPVLQGDVQKEWLRRFNSDTIAQTLEAITGVRKAQVIIAQPEESVFTSVEKPTQASVMLVVEPGFRLKQTQIKTIKNLVSHSVPGLTPDMVAISDNYGNALDDSMGLAGAGGTGREEVETRRRKLETELQHKLLHLLEPIVGQDNAVVSVTAELNLDEARSKIHTVTPTLTGPDGAVGVVVSRQEQNESYSGSKPPGEGGTTGTANNSAPVYKSASGKGENGKSYESTKSTTNYAHSEEDKEIIYASGTIRRLSVAVAINKALLPSEIEELKTMIGNAAGLSAERGDSVDLRGFQFSEPPNKKGKDISSALEEGLQQDFILRLTYLGILVVLGLSAMFIFYNLLKKPAQAEWVGEPEEEEEATLAYLPPSSGVSDVQQALQAAIASGDQKAIANATAAAQAAGQGDLAMRLLGQTPLGQADPDALPILESPLSPEVESIRAALHATIAHDPEDAARLLVSYMKDEVGL